LVVVVQYCTFAFCKASLTILYSYAYAKPQKLLKGLICGEGRRCIWKEMENSSE
jgi:hypothetical protein